MQKVGVKHAEAGPVRFACALCSGYDTEAYKTAMRQSFENYADMDINMDVQGFHLTGKFPSKVR